MSTAHVGGRRKRDGQAGNGRAGNGASKVARSNGRTNGRRDVANGQSSAVASRKSDHVRLNLSEDVTAKGIASGFEDYRLLHRALPEIDLPDIDTSAELFGRRFAAPILISCMTGGTEESRKINRSLAEAAQALGLPMGLGSGRVLLEHPELLETFAIRDLAPDILLFANLGAVQLNKGYGIDDCRRLVSMLEADALVLHLNALQEAVQPEGDTCFAGLLAKIERICAKLDAPVVVKEVGWGISGDMVRALLDAGVSAVDVAGAGGTSWTEVERHRIAEPWRARVAAAFAGWGISTAECLREARRVAPHARIFASGGIKNGIDVAKAVALGANLVGIAGPFLRAAAAANGAVHDLGREFIEELRIAMFGIGAKTIAELSGSPRLVRNGDARSPLYTTRFDYRTEGGSKFLDITDDVTAAVSASGVRNGIVHVYSTHTTAAIRINENEQLLLHDFERFLERIAPAGAGAYEHDDIERRLDVPPGEPMNGHAHCRHLLLASSETLPVVDGRLGLGRWQRVFLVELCSARDRSVIVQVLGH